MSRFLVRFPSADVGPVRHTAPFRHPVRTPCNVAPNRPCRPHCAIELRLRVMRRVLHSRVRIIRQKLREPELLKELGI